MRTVWAGSLPLQYPVVDLGGGALGSVGNNDFGNGSEYAVDLGGPYDVSAKDNLWSGTAIESRIHDPLDDPLLGHVHYEETTARTAERFPTACSPRCPGRRAMAAPVQ